MKRALASLVSFGILLGVSTPALASPNYRTKGVQARVSIRENQSRALHAWKNRASAFIAQRREYYNHVIRPVVSRPVHLTVTGADQNREARPVARPGKRTTQMWTLSGHCTMGSRRCE